MKTDIAINTVSHTADGYNVTYTVISDGAKSKIKMLIPASSLPSDGGIESNIRAYLTENLSDL